MVEYKQISHNISVLDRTSNDIKYIVIHDTGNSRAGADAEMHYRYFNSMNRDSSADIFVDSKKILKTNNYYKFYTWHCGDGQGKYGVTNSNSVGVEMCINSDGNYGSAFELTVWVTQNLMEELGVSPKYVVRHYDASRKICPRTFSEESWKLWQQFKYRIGNNEKVAPMIPRNTIEDLQQDLNLLGYELIVDGIFGNKTTSAVKDFQMVFNLQVDGIAGVQTNTKLKKVVSRKQTSQPPF